MTPLVIGHRGAAGHAPENTLLSFRRALELGVDSVEFDVQRTSDGHLVVIHDRTVERTTGGRGRVADMTLDSIRALDAGEGERVPTLHEVLELLGSACGAMIELKSRGIAADVVETVRRSRKAGVLYASFLHDELLNVREADSSASTIALWEGDLRVDPESIVASAGAQLAGVGLETFSELTLQKLHATGTKVWVYTVNDSADIERLMQVGVDGIITDYPERVRRALSALG